VDTHHASSPEVFVRRVMVNRIGMLWHAIARRLHHLRIVPGTDIETVAILAEAIPARIPTDTIPFPNRFVRPTSHHPKSFQFSISNTSMYFPRFSYSDPTNFRHENCQTSAPRCLFCATNNLMYHVDKGEPILLSMSQVYRQNGPDTKRHVISLRCSTGQLWEIPRRMVLSETSTGSRAQILQAALLVDSTS
jgi:hypothetical protein